VGVFPLRFFYIQNYFNCLTLNIFIMKKFYSLFTLVVLVVMCQFSFGQFYDGFTGTGNIGGNCIDVNCSENGWTTHSGTLPATIDILAGSLSYSGLQASTGNKVWITGNTVELARDVNAAVTLSGEVAYYSVLIKVIDATNLGENGFNYFMSFGDAAGISVTGLYGRLGICGSNGGSNFKFGILNTSGGTTATSFTGWTSDLTFGTTYLVVVKYDIPTNTATLWVNPSLGGTEPAGGITNATGTGVASSFASICIRNGYDTNAAVGTPNAEIDEIRVNTTYAAVTPLGNNIENVESNLISYPNPVQNFLNISEKANVKVMTIAGQVVINVENVNSVDMSSLQNGMYIVTIENEKGTQIEKIMKY
jgi:hypothetical protein